LAKRYRQVGRSYGGKVISHQGKLVFEHINGDTVVLSKNDVAKVVREYNESVDEYEVRVYLKNGSYHVAHERFATELLNFKPATERGFEQDAASNLN